MAKFSKRDAGRIDAFSRELEAIADVLRQLVLQAPPNVVEGFGIGSIREAFNALGTANVLRGLTLEQQRSLLDLFTLSAGEMLDQRFDMIWSRRSMALTPSSAITPAPTPPARPM